MDKLTVINSLFTTLARSEEQLHPDATLLPNFPRGIQLNSHTCGSVSTFIILNYFGKSDNYPKVERQLGTDEDGTSPSDIKRVFKKYGLKVSTKTNMTIRDLNAAINNGSPVLISICDDEHYAVVYGYSRTHVFVMNSSLDASDDGVGSIKVAVPRKEFLGYWDKWGIVVSRK